MATIPAYIVKVVLRQKSKNHLEIINLSTHFLHKNADKHDNKKHKGNNAHALPSGNNTIKIQNINSCTKYNSNE